jgi:hypothetical protein
VRDPDLQTTLLAQERGRRLGLFEAGKPQARLLPALALRLRGNQLPESGEAAVEGRLALARIGIALGLRGRIQEAVGYAIMLKIPTYSNANLWAKRIDPAAATRPGNT